MARKPKLAVGLDIGSSFTRVVVLLLEDGCLRFRGSAVEPSRGWQRGQIADQSAVAGTVRAAISQAEAASGLQIGSAVVGVGGPTVRSQQGRGLYEFGHKRPIERGDLSYSIELAARARLEEDRFLLQVLAQDFTVDGRTTKPHPLNLECERLEAHALLLTTSLQEHQALISAVHQAHLRVEETIFEAMAAAFASILPEERAGGVALLDIGCHSSHLIFYDGDTALFAIGMPLSGDHFTHDLCLKSLSYKDAELLKIQYGCALLGLTADNIVIERPAEDGRPSREIYRRDLIETLEVRAAQLFHLVEHGRAHRARDMQMREGIVLCGGGSHLSGMVEKAEKSLGCPARLGVARGIIDWPESLANSLWTTAAGLAMYSARLQSRDDRDNGPNLWNLFRPK